MPTTSQVLAEQSHRALHESQPLLCLLPARLPTPYNSLVHSILILRAPVSSVESCELPETKQQPRAAMWTGRFAGSLAKRGCAAVSALSLEVSSAATSWKISSHGRVMSGTGTISYGFMACIGYRRVCIAGQFFLVHRLVAAAFLGRAPSPAHWMVNHLDSDRCNNHVSNLKYVTPGENVRHAWTANGSERLPKQGRIVLWRACGHEFWSSAASQAEAARALGVSPTCVSRCCRGLSFSCEATDGRTYQFQFKQLDDGEEEDESWKEAVHAGDGTVVSGLMVSNYGRILRAADWGKKLPWRGYQGTAGYCLVNKAGRSYRVHRLVAGTFLGQPASRDLQVNHKDSNRWNNRADNLEYVTHSQNMKHAFRQNNGIIRNGFCKPVQVRAAGLNSPWHQFSSIKAAADHTGTKERVVSRVCSGREDVRHINGWEFRFVPMEPFAGEEWRPVVLEGARVLRQRRT